MKRIIILLSSILALGFLLRIIGINWDAGYYLHPDERAIFMFSLPIGLPYSIQEFFSPTSPLNPTFFAYGSFPMYVLKFFSHIAGGIDMYLSGYSGAYFVGRLSSILLDTGIILLVFLVATRIFSRTAGFVSAFFYAVAVFPIQTSHFYTADTFLSFFLLLSFYLLILFIQKDKLYILTFCAIAFGLALASKVSALPFFAVVLCGVFYDFCKYVGARKKIFSKKGVFTFLDSVFLAIFFFCIAFLTLAIAQPYAFIDLSEFLRQISEQQRMTESAFTFPYTLQYVGKVPYVYEFSQIFFWGLGIPLSIVCFIGIFYWMFLLFKKQKKKHEHFHFFVFLLLLYFFIFFGIIGTFAVGWMRYLLPLYPLLCIAGGVLLFDVFKVLRRNSQGDMKKYGVTALSVAFLFLCSVWTILFIQIYLKPNPRVEASQWIHQNVPAQASLAQEHWDDNLPLYGVEKYEVLTLPLYEVESDNKWNTVQDTLSQADYIIISSQRLYVPLTKLGECGKYPEQYCYEKTAKYYSDLFSGKLDFSLVKEFSSYPGIPFVNFSINDLKADESFSVYDHPKVLIFKKKGGSE